MSILCINTHGPGGQDERRICLLTRSLGTEVVVHHLDRTCSYQRAMQRLQRCIQSRTWDLIYQEGTGIAGGATLIQAARRRGQKFIVSSGDPVGGFFRVTKGPALGALFHAYERQLYRACAGFVGWTPYLTGAALALGARRGVTVEGGADLDTFVPFAPAERRAAKESLGLDPSHLVCGVVGSLRWTPRQSYCYGLELVEILKRLKRPDISVLIIGDGSGKAILQQRVPDHLRSRIVFTGRLPEPEVVRAMNAMDIGFITQTLDGLGNFRLTTKLPEYLACGLPVAMSPVPGFYDYASGAGWALPARHPASTQFHERCAAWLEDLDREEIAEKAQAARPLAFRHFDYNVLSKRFRLFVEDILEEA